MSIDVLLQENAALRSGLAERDERISDLEIQLELLAKKLRLTARERGLLEQKLKQLQAMRQRHPYLDPGQGLFDFDGGEPKPAHVGEAPDGETKDDPIRQRNKPKKPARKLDTSNLPVEHVIHELPEEQRVCPTTGRLLVPVGEKLEEEIDFQPGFIKRIVHHRVIYGLAEEDARERQAPQIITPGPPRPLEQSIAGASLLAWIVDQKYVRHLPLYRQEAILEQHGLRLPRQTACDWVMGVARELEPIQEAIRRELVATKLIQTDDTPVKCQLGKGRGLFQAHLWATTSPLLEEWMLFDFTESREHEHLFKILPDFEEGVLVGDRYKGYEAFARARPGVALAGCWVHVIRKFRDALGEAPAFAAEVMTVIGKLFDIEKRADAEGLSLEDRLILRQAESARVVDQVEAVLAGWRDIYLESGKVSDACKYVDNQPEGLRAFLSDARIPIHNNACEVAIRPVAVGRRNWLFAGSPRGGRAAATIYTVVESCKRAKVDTMRYLADVLRSRTWSRPTGSGSSAGARPQPDGAPRAPRSPPGAPVNSPS